MLPARSQQDRKSSHIACRCCWIASLPRPMRRLTWPGTIGAGEANHDQGSEPSPVQVLLESIAATPSAPIDELGIMAASEAQVVLQTFNQTDRGDAAASEQAASEGAFRSQTIHGMLQFWATETPYAPAARFEVSPTAVQGCRRHAPLAMVSRHGGPETPACIPHPCLQAARLTLPPV